MVHILPYGVMWQRTGLWDQLARAADAIPGAVVRRSELAIRLPNGGSALHMTTVNAAPGTKLVLVGALGPLQSSGASGALTFLLAEKDGQTTVTVTYDVGGYFKGGLDKIAAPVDGVLGQQVAGLKAAAEAK